MSAQAVGAAAAGAEISPGAIAVSQRIEQLQSMIAKAQEGPASFAAALETAVSGTSGASASPASTASTSSYPAGGELEPSTSEAAVSGVPYASLIDQAAAENGLDPAVLAGLVKQESGFDPSATSGAGAQGLTQLMPGTASSLGVSEPLDPAQSIAGGARYLGDLERQFGGNVTDALAAYNAGPGAVQQYGGVPPYAETQQYVSDVLNNAAGYRQGGAGTPAMTAVPA